MVPSVMAQAILSLAVTAKKYRSGPVQNHDAIAAKNAALPEGAGSEQVLKQDAKRLMKTLFAPERGYPQYKVLSLAFLLSISFEFVFASLPPRPERQHNVVGHANHRLADILRAGCYALWQVNGLIYAHKRKSYQGHQQH